MTPKGHREIRGHCNLLLTSDISMTICCRIDLVYDIKGHMVFRGRRDLFYDPKGHGDLCGRFDLVYDPLM